MAQLRQRRKPAPRLLRPSKVPAWIRRELATVARLAKLATNHRRSVSRPA